MTRAAALALLALAGCGKPPAALDELLRQAYRDLQTGELDSALARAEEGRARARGDGRAGRPFGVLTGEVVGRRQRNVEALALLDRVLAAPPGPDPVVVRARMTRGLVRCRAARTQSERRDGEGDLEQAAREAAAVGSDELAAEVTLRRGTCCLQQGQAAAAAALFRAALDGARRMRLPFLEANASGSLAATRIAAGEYDAATDWLQRTLDIASRAGAETTRAKTIHNLGWCYLKLGDYDRALGLLEEAERLTAARGLAGDRVAVLTNIGNIHFLQHDYARAAEVYRRALQAGGELGNKWHAAILTGNLGEIALEEGNYDGAEADVAGAVRMMDELGDRPEVLRLRLAQGDIDAGRGQVAAAEALYREVVTSPDARAETLWHGHASLARLYAGTGRPEKARAEFSRAFAIIDERRASLREAGQRMTFFASLRRFYDDYVQFLVDQRRPEEALVIAELSRARLLRERLSRPDVPARSSVAAFLAAARALDAVVLSYWTGRQRSWLWVVGPAGVRIHALPGEAELRRDVEDYQRRVLLSRDPLAERPPEGERLWRALLAPAQREVARSARVVLVPDGPLHQLNFETLPVPGAAPRYWIEDATVLTAPSLSLVSPRTAPRTAPPALLLAIGDPIPAGPEFPRLAHAADELREVARGFGAGRATVITGADAVPAAYVDARPERFGFVHFAAHVTANRESPLDSAIVLAPREEAYKLYARDVVGVPLAAELVTLSACRSAGARALAGEGLVGLSWSFLSAGAGNVVGGLWNVEDASSASLMAALYRGVGRGADPAVALRDAKLALLRSGTAYRKPFYWGAFVIYTRNPRPPR